jgi:hypothetical protein
MMATLVRPLKLICAFYEDPIYLILHAEGEDAEGMVNYTRWADEHALGEQPDEPGLYVWEGTCQVDDDPSIARWDDRFEEFVGSFQPATLEDLRPLVKSNPSIPTASELRQDELQCAGALMVDKATGRYCDWEKW